MDDKTVDELFNIINPDVEGKPEKHSQLYFPNVMIQMKAENSILINNKILITAINDNMA